MSHETTRTVPVDHPAFAGHFPGRPILPGVVLLAWAIEALAGATGEPVETCEVGTAKFLHPVGPGARLAIRHSPQASGAWRFEIAMGDAVVASGTLRPAGAVA